MAVTLAAGTAAAGLESAGRGKAGAAAPGTPHRSLVLTVILSVTVLQRFALPFAGSVVGVGFVLSLTAGVWGLVTRRMRIDPARTVLFAIAMAALLLTLVMRPSGYSKLSFAMLVVAYLFFILYLPLQYSAYLRLLRSVQAVTGFVAVSGLVQFMAQFAVGRDWMFPFDLVLPPALFIPNFNLRIPLGEGLAVLKSNGLWLLEPSHFSQTIALSLIIEFLYFRRIWFLALLAAAYLVSFSGTGLLLLVGTGILGAMVTRRWEILVAILVAALAALLLRDVPPFSYFAARIAEFTNPLSSGSMRLLAPYWWVSDVLLASARSALLGFGPGNIELVLARVDYSVQDSSWLKLFGEYGLIGGVPFILFYLYVLLRHSPSIIISLACLVQFALLGGYLNSFYIQFLHLLLVGWPRISASGDRLNRSDAPAPRASDGTPGPHHPRRA